MYRCLLWDFGDTLCDERFIWGAGPEWLAVYDTFDDGHHVVHRWDTGEVDTAGFTRQLSTTMGLTPAEIEAHMVERSTNHIEFFPFTYALFRSQRLPQAIVTVNPDLFSDVIVPAHDLASPCDTIVTSWEEGTIDKSILCALAVERIDPAIAPGEALLIDNRQDNLDAWASVGGPGHLFTTDEAFRAAVDGGLLDEG